MRFVFQRYNRCSVSEFFHRFGQIVFNLAHTFAARHEKRMVPVFFKVSVDQLFDNLESGKKIIVLEKLLEKVLNFGSKKQSVRTLPPGSLCTDPLPSGKIGGGGGYVHRLLPEQFSSLK